MLKVTVIMGPNVELVPAEDFSHLGSLFAILIHAYNPVPIQWFIILISEGSMLHVLHSLLDTHITLCPAACGLTCDGEGEGDGEDLRG